MIECLRHSGERWLDTKNKVCSDKEFLEGVLNGESRKFGGIIKDAAIDLGMSRATADRYLKRLVEAGLVRSAGGLYWRIEEAGNPAALRG